MQPPLEEEQVPETLTIYDDPNDRYLVSLIVSYSDAVLEGLLAGVGEDLDEGGGEGLVQESTAIDRAVAGQTDKMKAAALAALELTRDAGSHGTQWYVYDRLTGTDRLITQSDFDVHSER
ncbi:MAG TPA: hypothetical protein VM305_04045 [Candidatus Limnocylindrales bacterium]|nr:hypothetical protein [Candidatus Limnocylindrales bacterium]